jgi:hypothetical protein
LGKSRGLHFLHVVSTPVNEDSAIMTPFNQRNRSLLFQISIWMQESVCIVLGGNDQISFKTEHHPACVL